MINAMPIYEYECGACGHQLEAFQKVSDAPLVECPTCQRPALSKLISSTSFQLKGTGWYVTDFRDKGKPSSSAKSDTPASPTTDSTSSTNASSVDSGANNKTNDNSVAE